MGDLTLRVSECRKWSVVRTACHLQRSVLFKPFPSAFRWSGLLLFLQWLGAKAKARQGNKHMEDRTKATSREDHRQGCQPIN
jgi:hypothetical protein